MTVATLVLMYLVASAGAQTCLTSSEEFAAEVVIPDYNFERAQALGHRFGSSVILNSQHDPSNLLTVLTEASIPHGLALRLQRPTEEREIERPHLKFTSYSLPGTVRTTGLVPLYYGWSIECDARECLFEKDLMSITASVERPEQGVTFEIDNDLPLCTESCSGTCVTFAEESRCFNAQLKTEMDSILRYANISTSFQQAFNSYRLVGTEGITLRDLAPTNNKAFDWDEAMREELVYLDSQGIIDLSRNDIEQIASLTREGQAGHNYRIVFDIIEGEWNYYDKTPDAVLSSERDCRAYTLAQQSPVLDVGVPIQTYYLIPLIVGTSGIMILIVLVIVARVISSRARHVARKHHASKKI